MLRLYEAEAAWLGWLQGLALASALTGLAAFIYSGMIRPERPPAWRARRPLSLARLGPPAAFLLLAGLGAVAAMLMPDRPATLAWRLLADSAQIAFALAIWEARWVWTQYADAAQPD